jgi:hypothetical protein
MAFLQNIGPVKGTAVRIRIVERLDLDQMQTDRSVDGQSRLIAHSPWRHILPFPQLDNRPGICLAGVARRAGIWNAGLFGFNGCDESKRVRSDVAILDRLFNLRHVAGNALTTCAVRGVVGVLSHRSRQSRRVLFGVATEAQCVSLPNQV